jgi:hypothetical protein
MHTVSMQHSIQIVCRPTGCKERTLMSYSVRKKRSAHCAAFVVLRFAGMNGRNYDLLLSRMTTIANRHEELKLQLEMMTNEEVQNILNERRNMKISTRLENYEEALKQNPLETPKVMSRRRPPEMIQKAREVKWSAVAFHSVIRENKLTEECAPAHVSSPSKQLEDDRSIARSANSAFCLKTISPAPGNKSFQLVKKISSPEERASLPPLPSLTEEHHPGRSNPRRHVDVDRLHRTTAIESIRLQLQKEQLKTIQAKFDSIKAFPGYVPPPTVVYSNPDEQLQAAWRCKALHARPERKKPWALPENLRPRRRKKRDVIEVVAEETNVELVAVAAPVKSAMELMMDMNDEDEYENDASDHADADLPPVSADHPETNVHAEEVHVQNVLPGDTSVGEKLPMTIPETNQSAVAAETANAPLQSLAIAERPGTSTSYSSEADSMFTWDSDAMEGKKPIVLSGEASHAIIMSELPVSVQFEDILLEKVLSGEEIHKISTQKADNKPLRTGDLFLLGRFLKGDVMLVPESYQESESSGDEGDDFSVSIVVGSRGNSRRGPRSHGSKSRSRSRPSTREGDAGFVMASDFVQVSA